MKKLRWSEWFSLGDLDRIDIPPLPGVYEIRWAIDGIPQPISRANKTDNSGCLYIGKSENLEDRLKKFRRGIRRVTEGHVNRNIHSGTLTYSYFGFQKKFKPKQL